MGKAFIQESTLEDIADAIRAKNGSQTTYLPSEMADAIAALSDNKVINPKDVNFWDYEGTLIASYTKAEALLLTELPQLPDRTAENLTNEGWNWTLSEIVTQLNDVGGEVNVGCTYHTTDNITYIYVKMYKEASTISIQLNPSTANDVTIDWGDNNTDTLSTTGLQTVAHTYNISSNIDFVIKISSTNTWTLESYMFGAQANHQNLNCKEIKFSNKMVGINGTYTFAYLYTLRKVNIPEGVVSASNRTYTFHYCYNIRCLVFPRSINNISSYKGGYIYNLETVCLAPTVTAHQNYAFRYSYGIKHITYGRALTSIGQNGIQGNYGGITELHLGPNISSIGSAYFAGNTYLREIYINRSTPPTIQTTTLANTIYAVYVPSAAVATYQAASNWSDYASIIKAMPS